MRSRYRKKKSTKHRRSFRTKRRSFRRKRYTRRGKGKKDYRIRTTIKGPSSNIVVNYLSNSACNIVYTLTALGARFTPYETMFAYVKVHKMTVTVWYEDVSTEPRFWITTSSAARRAPVYLHRYTPASWETGTTVIAQMENDSTYSKRPMRPGKKYKVFDGVPKNPIAFPMSTSTWAYSTRKQSRWLPTHMHDMPYYGCTYVIENQDENTTMAYKVQLSFDLEFRGIRQSTASITATYTDNHAVPNFDGSIAEISQAPP